MLKVRLLGPIAVEHNHQPVHLAPRAVGVIVRLAVAGRPLLRDQLLADLWGDDVDPARRRSLHTIVSAIRKTLGDEDSIGFDGSSYRLNSAVTVDALDVLSAAATGATRPALGPDRGALTIHKLGTSTWIDEFEADVYNAIDVLANRPSRLPGPVEYAENAGAHIAYQVSPGVGLPVVLNAGLGTHCLGIWEAPGFASWIAAAFGDRPVFIHDMRGAGLSDPINEVPDDRRIVADALAAIAAAGLDRYVLVCAAEAGMFGPHLAVADRPNVAGVVFINATARLYADPDFAHGLPASVADEFGQGVRKKWARDNDTLKLSAPSRTADTDFAAWADSYQLLVASPGSIWQLAQYTGVGDGRAAVGQIDRPSLIVQSQHSRYFRPTNATWFYEQMPHARLVWLDSADHLFWVADPETATSEIAAFVDSLDALSDC